MATESEHLLNTISRCSRCIKLHFDKYYFISFLITILFFLHAVDGYEDIPGLYKPSDPIVELYNDTWKGQLYGSKKVWIVEFYSSWCGHCQAFAPKWVRLSIQLQNWNKYVEIGALNCANDRNRVVCNTFNIGMYPTIKYFHYDWQNITDERDDEGFQKMGYTYKGSKSILSLRHTLIDIIENETNVNYDKSDIPFKPIRGPDMVLKHLTEQKNKGYQYMALIFDEDDSYIAKNIIMDTSKSKHVVARRASDEDKALAKKYEVKEFPSLILIHLDNGGFEELSPVNRTYLGFVYSLQKILDFVAKAPENPKDPVKESVEPIKFDNLSSEIHMTDLLSAVSFSLRREVTKKPVIKGEALDALKGWVNLLVQCFPAEKSMLSFLRKLDLWLHNNSRYKKIHTADYVKFFENNQKVNAFLPQEIEWRACRGSEAKFRGFPCSLWTLFHTMASDCGSKYSKTTLAGLDLMNRIRGFIDHFFGCRYCRDHFMAMSKDVAKEVSTHDSAIMWLWEHHNKVNARLRDDISSDPYFPKVQFPPKEMCELCRSSETSKENTLVTDPGHGVPPVKWNKAILFEFLKEHYGPDNIRVNDKAMVGAGSPDTQRPKFSYKFYPKSRTPATLSFIGLTRIDMSLCVVLYLAVIGTLIALYLYFIKRRQKKQWKNIV